MYKSALGSIVVSKFCGKHLSVNKGKPKAKQKPNAGNQQINELPNETKQPTQLKQRQHNKRAHKFK